MSEIHIPGKASVSALYWLPRVLELGIQVPKTAFVPIEDYLDLMRIFDGEEPSTWKDLSSRIDAAAEQFGEACFLRTDIGSAKHSGPKAYRFPGPDSARFQPVIETIEDHELKHMFGPDPQALMLREFLELEAPFTAFGGLPISREWRFFADAGRVHCAHFYWPHSAIEFRSGVGPPGWREALDHLQQKPAEFEDLSRLAIEAAGACGAFPWSVDFAKTVDGRWYLIDMAPMHQSWHWEDCPNNPERPGS